MMRSLFAGVSGLKTHQTRMDVIGNNIANVNTVAYKYSSMTFASLMSQTTQRASGRHGNGRRQRKADWSGREDQCHQHQHHGTGSVTVYR